MLIEKLRMSAATQPWTNCSRSTTPSVRQPLKLVSSASTSIGDGITRRIEASKLPDGSTHERVNVDFQPNLDIRLVLDLATLTWVGRNKVPLLVAPSGVGKSHVKEGIRLIACSQEPRVVHSSGTKCN